MRRATLPLMLLDPRAYRLDDLLRRPHLATSWGEPWLPLTLLVNGEPLFPEAGFWRPSHQSLFGRDSLSELQVTQDSLVAQDGTQVVTLLLRNPSAEAVWLELATAGGVRGTHRCLPPLDDLLFQLPEGAFVQRTFTLSEHPDTDTAFKQATRWYFEKSPASVVAQQLDDWQKHNAFLFECFDPWLTRLVAHCQALRWRGIVPPQPPSDGGAVQDGFVEGDFDAPRDDCPAWDSTVQERLVGARVTGEILHITPDNFLNLSSFCLQGFHGTTIAWDDPAHPDDAFGDGDKGLTVYVGRTRAYNQPTLAPCTISLASKTSGISRLQ